MAGHILISYRRADTAQVAGWLHGRLTAHFGRPQVVKDLDSIQLGDDAAGTIVAAVASCDVLLALIGPQWLTAAGLGPADPGDFVRLEIESALAGDVLVIPVLVDGARLPRAGDLPPSLAGLAQQPALELSPGRFDADATRLLQVLDESLAQRQATQTSRVGAQPTAKTLAKAQPTATARRPPRSAAPGQTKPMPRRRFRTRTLALAGGGIVAMAAVVVLALPRSHPAASSSAATSHHGSSRNSAAPSLASSAASSPSPSGSAKVLVADDFSTRKIAWVDDYHHSAGAYTGSGTYRLSVTGANGQNELARPSGATDGLSGVTPVNLSVSVDARKLAGAPQGYGYGLAFRSDGSGDLYAFLIEDHAVAIQKWVGNGAQVADSPAPVRTSALHTDAADRLRAVVQTADGGRAVHLELWLNGKKMVDYTDRDHPYIQGYLGLYVESISDATSTAGAEFDNFTASQL